MQEHMMTLKEKTVAETTRRKRVLWFDDQLVEHQQRLLRRYLDFFDDVGVDLVKAYDPQTFVKALKDNCPPAGGAVTIDALVLDLMVPQQRGVATFAAFGLPHVRIDVYTCGVQVAEILFGTVYADHRRTWEGGLLQRYANLKCCILSTNEEGLSAFSGARFGKKAGPTIFWKDAPAGHLEAELRAWLG